MKEIKIVFRVGESDCMGRTFFDLFIDGEKQEDVKNFEISLTNEPNKDNIYEDYTYRLEKYINLEPVFMEYGDQC